MPPEINWVRGVRTRRPVRTPALGSLPCGPVPGEHMQQQGACSGRGRREHMQGSVLVRGGGSACIWQGKLLRREILTPAFFTRRVCGVPPRLVGYLRGGRRAFSLVHPKTPAAASYAKNHLSPFVSRTGADLLKEYEVVTARAGLALLERRVINGRRRSERRSDLCVYDPITGARAFFPFPPNIRRDVLTGAVHTYAPVTAADGAAIGCPFVLLAAGMSSLLDFTTTVRVQTASPSGSDAGGGGGQWGPVKLVDVRGPGRCLADTYNSAVVLGGVVHRLMYSGDSIFTYDVVTGATGSVELPDGARWPEGKGRYALEANLAATPDGRLKLLVANEFTVSVWVLRPGSRWNWEPPAVIDTEPTIRSALDPGGGGGGHGIKIFTGRGEIKLVNSGIQRTGAVFLRVTVDNGRPDGRDVLLVLDVETKEIRRVRGDGGVLYEVDLASRLSAMKIF